MPLQSIFYTTVQMNFENASLILLILCLHFTCIILSMREKKSNSWIGTRGFPWSKPWLCTNPHLPPLWYMYLVILLYIILWLKKYFKSTLADYSIKENKQWYGNCKCWIIVLALPPTSHTNVKIPDSLSAE